MIVVGHTECGGAKHCVEASCKPAPTEPPEKPLLRWLEPLTKLARSLNLCQLPIDKALPILVRRNVKRQVENIKNLKTVKDANVAVHGWIHDLSTGLLDDKPNLDA